MIKFLQTIRLYVGFPKVQSSVLFFSSSILMIFFSPLNILRLFSLLMIQIFFCVIKICLHQELLLVSSWFRANKPTVLRTNLNLSFFIHNVKRLISQELKNIFLTIPLYLVYRKTIIQESLFTKTYLGNHISLPSVVKFLRLQMFLASHDMSSVPTHTLKAPYNSLFLPYISYCILILGSTHSSDLDPTTLQITKESYLHYFTFSPLRTQSKPLFTELHVLPLHTVYTFQVSCFVVSITSYLLFCLPFFNLIVITYTMIMTFVLALTQGAFHLTELTDLTGQTGH